MERNNKINEALMRDSTKKQMQNLLKDINHQGGDIGSKVRKDEKTKEDKMPNAVYMDNPFDSDRFIDTWEHFSTHDAHNRTTTDKMNDSKRGGVVESFEKFTSIKEDFDEEDFDEEDFDEAAVSLINDLKYNYNVTDQEINQLRNLLEDGNKEEFVKRYIKKTGKTVSELPEAILASELLEKVSTKTSTKVSTKTSTKTPKKEEKVVLGINDWIQTLDSDVIGNCCDKTKPMFVNRPNITNRSSYDVLRTGKFIEFEGYTGQIIGIKGNQIELDIIDENNKHVSKTFPLNQVLKALKNNEIEVDKEKKKNKEK